MKCNFCGKTKVNVAEVRACEKCASPNDGTANELRGLSDDATIEEAVAQVPGVGNRFVYDSGEPRADRLGGVEGDWNARGTVREGYTRPARLSGESSADYEARVGAPAVTGSVAPGQLLGESDAEYTARTGNNPRSPVPRLNGETDAAYAARTGYPAGSGYPSTAPYPSTAGTSYPSTSYPAGRLPGETKAEYAARIGTTLA